MVAVSDVTAGGVERAGFIPCWIRSSGQPEPLGRTGRGARVVDYVKSITTEVGLPTRFRWRDGVMWVRDVGHLTTHDTKS